MPTDASHRRWEGSRPPAEHPRARRARCHNPRSARNREARSATHRTPPRGASNQERLMACHPIALGELLLSPASPGEEVERIPSLRELLHQLGQVEAHPTGSMPTMSSITISLVTGSKQNRSRLPSEATSIRCL